MYHINKVKSKFFDFEPILSGPRNVILFTLILSFVKSSWFLHIYGHAKGQLILKCLLGVVVSTKKPTKFF